MGLFHRHRNPTKEQVRGRRLADETEDNLCSLKSIAGRLNETADKMALATQRMQKES